MASAEDLRREYETWVRLYGAELFRFALRVSGNRNLAEDLVQETFCEAWRNVGQLQDRPKARAWLYRILRRRYWHWRRDSSRRVKVVQSQDGASQNVASASRPVLERMAAEDALQYALNTLDEQLRLPLLMVLMEGLTCKEAAEQLEIPLGTVLSRIHRARQLLQQVLQEHEIARVTTDGTPKHAKQ